MSNKSAATTQTRVSIETQSDILPEIANRPISTLSTAVRIASFGAISYVACCVFLCLRTRASSDATSLAYYSQIPRYAFEYPMVAFGGATIINLMTLLFERQSHKMQISLLAVYINLLAGSCHLLHVAKLAPITVDSFGAPMEIVRVVMWLHATPAMIYLLSTISDFPQRKVFQVIGADICMLVSAIILFVSPYRPFAVAAMTLCFCCFFFVIPSLFAMFSTPIEEATTESNRRSLQVLRAYTMTFWSMFPVLWALSYVLPVSVMACAFGMADVMGKIIFSSSLLHGNFLSLDQRRMMAMRIVEEANRLKVIEELQELIVQKERFFSSISHELRTPLNGIIGLSEALLCGELPEGVKKTLATIKSSGARLLNLINDILDAASHKQGTLVVKDEKVNIFNIVSDVLALTQPLVRKGVKLVNRVPESVPFVLGDSGRIVQILYNLVGNACKFTHKGEISVEAHVPKGGSEVEVTVRDTGIGIPEDKFSSIFGEFEQVDQKTTRKYGGTGLGLALVKSLVEAHGSTIRITSKMGQGSSFTFSFKVYDAVADPASSGSDVGSVAGSIRSLGITTRPSLEQSLMAQMSLQLMPVLKTIKEGLPPEVAALQQQAAASRRTSKNEAAPTEGAAGYKPSYCSVHHTLQILSVDDDPINQMVISNFLQSAGYNQVLQAMDGEQALQHLEEADLMPDVILLDVMMPGMSGYEVCRKVREKYPHSAIPIIMLSAKANEEAVVEGLSSGSNDYVAKPLRRQELVARINSQLDYKQIVRHSMEVEMNQSPRSSTLNPKAFDAALTAPSSRTPFPAAISTQLAVSGTYSASVQQAGVVVLGVHNLQQAVLEANASEVVTALAELAAAADALAVEHKMHRVDNLLDRIVFLSGLDPAVDPARQARDFASALLTASKPHVNALLEVSIGLHVGPAQVTLQGMDPPFLHLAKEALLPALQLQLACPAGCLAACPAATLGDPEAFHPVDSSTSVLKAGLFSILVRQADGIRLRSLPSSFYMASQTPPLSPIQRSVLAVIKAAPALVLEQLLPITKGLASTAPATGAAAPVVVAGGAAAAIGGAVGDAALLEAQKQVEMLERQLEEVAAEADRLQDLVDSLEGAVDDERQGRATDRQKLQEVQGKLEARLAELERELALVTERLQASGIEMLELRKERARLLQHLQQGGGAKPRGSAPRISLDAGAAPWSASPRSAAPSESILAWQLGAQASTSIPGAPSAAPQPEFLSAVQAGMTVPELLREVGLGAAVPQFEAEEVTTDLLPFLEDPDLHMLGLTTIGARMRLRLAAQALQGT